MERVMGSGRTRMIVLISLSKCSHRPPVCDIDSHGRQGLYENQLVPSKAQQWRERRFLLSLFIFQSRPSTTLKTRYIYTESSTDITIYSMAPTPSPNQHPYTLPHFIFFFTSCPYLHPTSYCFITFNFPYDKNTTEYEAQKEVLSGFQWQSTTAAFSRKCMRTVVYFHGGLDIVR
jgi:hypothetical protein